MGASEEVIEDLAVLDLLTSLVDKSLVIFDAATGRYRLLETVRQYAGDRLEECGKTDAVCRRAAAWALELVEAAEPQLSGPETAWWLDCLEKEHDNLRAALDWYEGQTEGEEAGLRLTGALTAFWERFGHVQEGRQHFAAALARVSSSEPTQAWAKALCGAGHLALMEGDHEDAIALLRQSLTMSQILGHHAGRALPLRHLGGIAWRRGDFAEAQEFYSECLAIQRRYNLPEQALTLWLLGLNANSGDQRPLASSYLQECLALSRQSGDRWTMVKAYDGLALLANAEGDYEAAQRYCEQGLTLADDIQHTHGKGALYLHWADAARHRGQNADADGLFRRSLEVFLTCADKFMSSIVLVEFGLFLEANGQAQKAARLLGAAEALYQADGRRLPGKAYADLSAGPLATAFAEGQAMTWEQAVVFALGEA